MNAWFTVRVVLGLLIAPLAPGLLFGLLDTLFVPSPFGMQFFLGISSVAGYPPLLPAIVVYAFGLKRLPRTVWECALVGLLLGAIGYFWTVLDFSSIRGLEASLTTVAVTLPFIPVSMSCGAIAGGAFWLFIRRELKVPASN